MKVLLVGSGAREHALAWRIAASPELTRLTAAPGNPGMERLCAVRPVGAGDVEGLVALAVELRADLVVAGPEQPLALGLADRLAERGIPCFGPSRAAARIESSKAFLKAFADRHGLPTARHVAVRDREAARRALETFDPPFVVKADGLAAGKGVVITQTREEALAATADLLGGRLGEAGRVVVLEEHLPGEEASFFALCDGETFRSFGAAQDHKRAFDGDLGPNTGGMGAYSPAPVLTQAAEARALETLIAPTLAGLAGEGAPFRGVLFAGLMIDAGRPRLVEYNVRFGDPECQALMMRLRGDLLPYLAAAAGGGLSRLPPPEFSPECAVSVVLAARGYPEAPALGGEIHGAEADFGEAVRVFQAGVVRRGDGVLTASGGRVLSICARGADLRTARERAYEAASRIDFADGVLRRDIGWRALPPS